MTNKPNKIILHHSWLPEDNMYFDEFDAIRKYYVNSKGWLDVPYHYGIEYVDNKLVIQKGRPEAMHGAHCIGQNNESIGICVIGNFDKAAPSKERIDKLMELIYDIYDRYGKLPIEPHNKYEDKSCPGKYFPLEEVQLLASQHGEHWAQAEYDEFRNNGVVLDANPRFEDYATRAEMFEFAMKLIKGYKGGIE